MAPNNDPDDPYHHRDMCWGKVSDTAASILPFVSEMLPARADLYLQHRKGHWCWTDAEIKSLKHKAGVLHLEWPSIAKVSVLLSRPTCGTQGKTDLKSLWQSFKIDGFVRHDALQCFKKWTEYRDSTAKTPIKSTKLQENTNA